ncbi:3-hydroxyacyl-CoA dehydrogenase family protein [Paenibacillus sp. HJGM_3]|uniref:3-hydroxyacyl-CoA dehydrogenase family protein n=1 Tax=Paenibacillus sp. HJGM_3 TaxID=3379816 RepID=UPI00385E4B73
MLRKIAVLGAGTMGHGLAQLFAAHGLDVRLYDVHQQALESARRHIRRSLELIASERGTDTRETSETFESCEAEARIAYTTDLAAAVAEAELVIEAAPERLELKQALYRTLEPLVEPKTLVASNTSTFPLEQLSQEIGFAHRMLILHFFNPAVHVPLVEIVQPPGFPPEALAPVLALLRRCGKVPVVLNRDIPGFIANRLQAALLREALHLLASGVADARSIDAAVKHGPGLRWALHGPLETADFGGLDIWERVADQLFPLLDDTRTAPELLRRHVREGRLGVKSGQGLYPYADEAEVKRKVKDRDRRIIRLMQAIHTEEDIDHESE